MVNAFFARNPPPVLLGLLPKVAPMVVLHSAISLRLRRRLRALARRRCRGASAIEYGLMAAVISVAIIGGLSSLGIGLRDDVLKIISEMQTYLG